MQTAAIQSAIRNRGSSPSMFCPGDGAACEFGGQFLLSSINFMSCFYRMSTCAPPVSIERFSTINMREIKKQKQKREPSQQRMRSSIWLVHFLADQRATKNEFLHSKGTNELSVGLFLYCRSAQKT
jgi:hypothetical protein